MLGGSFYRDMLLENGLLIPADDLLTEWFVADKSILQNKEEIAKHAAYTTAYEDLSAIDAEGNAVVIPAGQALFPIKNEYENKEASKGTFTFGMADGSIYTKHFEKDGTMFLFDGKYVSDVLFMNYVGA